MDEDINRSTYLGSEQVVFLGKSFHLIMEYFELSLPLDPEPVCTDSVLHESKEEVR